MRALLHLFLDIALFRKGPQDVPPSVVLQRLCLLAYMLSGWMGLVVRAQPDIALASTLIDTALLAMLLWVGLYFKKHMRRYGQTLTALTGVGALFSILAWPFILWLTIEGNEGAIMAPALLLTAIGLWNITAIGHILRHAMGAQLSTCIFYAVGYTLLSWMLMLWAAWGI